MIEFIEFPSQPSQLLIFFLRRFWRNHVNLTVQPDGKNVCWSRTATFNGRVYVLGAGVFHIEDPRLIKEICK